MLVGLLFVGLYFTIDPSNSSFFPKCPFLAVTGLKCPGCGSQRAMHDLLHLRVGGAFRHHPLLVISIPYLAVGFFLDLQKEKNERMLRWRNRLLGINAVYTVLFVVLSYWLLRNVFDF